MTANLSSRWLFKQADRDDPAGDLARDAERHARTAAAAAPPVHMVPPGAHGALQPNFLHPRAKGKRSKKQLHHLHLAHHLHPREHAKRAKTQLGLEHRRTQPARPELAPAARMLEHVSAAWGWSVVRPCSSAASLLASRALVLAGGVAAPVLERLDEREWTAEPRLGRWGLPVALTWRRAA